MEQTGRLVIFSAPSGAGKTTLVKYLLDAGLPLCFSVSATSRIPRPGEKDGKDYYFMTADEFRRRIERDEFIEWEEVYPDQFYGTLRSEVERLRKKGNHVLFDVDVAGGLNIKKQYGDQALAIFVEPPSIEELERRLRSRSTEDEASLKKRLGKAAQELSWAGRFDKIIVNDDLEKARREAYEIVADFIGFNNP
ncbi:MAG: guanylate kinase [Bacteroidales bacterium]